MATNYTPIGVCKSGKNTLVALGSPWVDGSDVRSGVFERIARTSVPIVGSWVVLGSPRVIHCHLSFSKGYLT